jgi:hypothetical protein
MARRPPKDPAYLRKRALDTRRWRDRHRRRVAVYSIEVGERELDYCVRYAALSENQVGNKTAVNAALLRKGIALVLQENSGGPKKV